MDAEHRRSEYLDPSSLIKGARYPLTSLSLERRKCARVAGILYQNERIKIQLNRAMSRAIKDPSSVDCERYDLRYLGPRTNTHLYELVEKIESEEPSAKIPRIV